LRALQCALVQTYFIGLIVKEYSLIVSMIIFEVGFKINSLMACNVLFCVIQMIIDRFFLCQKGRFHLKTFRMYAFD
jgi:hypothetical protein